MKEWSNLPNARHVEWVIQSLRNNPEEWDSAWAAAYNAALGAAYNAAKDAARDAAIDAVRSAAWAAAWNAAWEAAWHTAWYAAGDAILVLIAYDDIEHYFLSSYEELRLIAELSQHPGAILLLPAVKTRELIEAKHEQVV